MSLQTSTITDIVSSVVTITPSQTLGLPKQLNTINFNPERLGLGPRPEENRSFGNFNNRNALNGQQDSLDSFEALQAYLSKFQQSTVSQNTPLPTEATTTSTTTTTQKSLISRLKARKNAYRARFFKPKTNLIKAAISSSLYSASIVTSSSSSVTLESSLVTVSSVSPLASLATSPVPSPVFSTNVVINVASNVRVAGDPVVTVTPALVTSIQTEVHTSVSSSVVSDSDDSEDDISLDYDDIIAIDNAKIVKAEETQSATVQTILPLASRPDLVTRSSVVTVYLSGSVPGVFSTSLSTVLYPGIRDPEETEDKEVIDRRKRHVEAIIQPSRTVILDTTEMREDAVNIIESGLNDILYDDSCRDKKITVTVTSTVSYCPVF